MAGLALVLGACADGTPSAGPTTLRAAEPAPVAAPADGPEGTGGEGPGAQSPWETDAPDPVSVRVDAVGIATDLIPLGIRESDGELEPPPDNIGGWWRGGPEPGEQGPAVLAGHVANVEGPDVFHTLVETPVGAEILVEREDGSVLVFVATRVEQHPKDDFPTDAVYSDTEEPTLRLVTCGGVYDRDVRSHRDNIIVFADYVGTA